MWLTQSYARNFKRFKKEKYLEELLELSGLFLENEHFTKMFLRTSILEFVCDRNSKIKKDVFEDFLAKLGRNKTAQFLNNKSKNFEVEVEYCEKLIGRKIFPN